MAETVKQFAVDLFCGCFGGSAGFIEMGIPVVGFDLEHLPHHGPVPAGAHLVIQDILTLHGSQFKNACFIWASPPCTEFSYMAMPWSRAKQIARALRGEGDYPDGYTGSRSVAGLTALFDACFRIQREAIAAAGHFIPMVVENVRGAIPWVGRSRWNYGSFHLWGDVPALMPMAKGVMKNGIGGSWFGLNPDGSQGALNNPRDGHKVGISWSKSGPGNPGKSFDGTAAMQMTDGYESHGMNWFNRELKGQDFTRIAGKQAGIKHGGDCFNDPSWPGKQGGVKQHKSGRTSSKSSARKAASAAIAKIPIDLARHIARTYRPDA